MMNHKDIEVPGLIIFTYISDEESCVTIKDCNRFKPCHLVLLAKEPALSRIGSIGGIGKHEFRHIGKNVVSAHPY